MFISFGKRMEQSKMCWSNKIFFFLCIISQLQLPLSALSSESAPTPPEASTASPLHQYAASPSRAKQHQLRQFLSANLHLNIIDPIDSEERTPLFVALSVGNAPAAELLLDACSASVHSPLLPGKRTQLHLAAQLGDLNATLGLIDHGSQIDAEDWRRATPLHYAALNGHIQIVQALLSRGADPNAVTQSYSHSWLDNREGHSALHASLSNGDLSEETVLKIVQLLVQYDADKVAENEDNQTPTQLAAARGYASVVKLLLKYELNSYSSKSEKKLISAKSKLLCAAVTNGSLALFNYIISELGQNWHELQCKNGDSLLQHTFINGHTELAHRLLTLRPQFAFESLGQNILTPLDMAAVNDYEFGLVRHILEILNSTGRHGETVYGVARLDILKLLLEYNYNVSTTAIVNNALYSQRYDVAEYLIEELGVLPNGESLVNAARRGNLTMLKLLLKRGSKELQLINTEKGRLESPTLVAAIVDSGNREMVEFILNKIKSFFNDSDASQLFSKRLLCKAALHSTIDAFKLLVETFQTELTTLICEKLYMESSKETLSLLEISVRVGSLELVEYLLEQGETISPRSTLLFHLRDYANNTVQMAELLVRHGASVRTRAYDYVGPKRFLLPKEINRLEGVPLLLHAVVLNSTELVRYLVEDAGLVLDFSDSHISLTLSLASYYCNLDLVQVLVKYGANASVVTTLEIPKKFIFLDTLTATPLEFALRQADYSKKLNQCHQVAHYYLAEYRFGPRRLSLMHQLVEQENLKLVNFALVNGANVRALDAERNTPLHLAAQLGDLEIIKSLLGARDSSNRHCAGVNDKNLKGLTVAEVACNSSTPLNPAVVQLLQGPASLKKSCNFKQKFNESLFNSSVEGWTGLHSLAASEFDPSFSRKMRSLLRSASLYAQDALGRTPLYIALKADNLKMAQLFLERYCVSPYLELSKQNGNRLIHLAAQLGDLEVIDNLLYLNTIVVEFSNRDWGKQPLHLAVQFGHLKVAETLLNWGANPLAEAGLDETPLHYISSNHSGQLALDFVQLFAKYEFNFTVSDSRFRTVLHVCAEAGHLAAVRYIVEQLGFDPRGSRMDRLYELTAAQGHIEVIHYLVERFKFDSKTDDVLCEAIQAPQNALELVKYLISSTDTNVFINCKIDFTTYTPLQSAIIANKSDIAEYFIQKWNAAEMDLSLLDKELTNSALHLAAKQCNYKIVNQLLQSEPRLLYVTDKIYFCTAIYSAVQCGQLEMVKLLVEKQRPNSLWLEREAISLDLAGQLGKLDIVKYFIDGLNDSLIPHSRLFYYEYRVRKDYYSFDDNEKKQIMSPLYWASYWGDGEMMKHFLSKGIPANQIDNTFDAKLSSVYAAIKGNGTLDLVKMLHPYDKTFESFLFDFMLAAVRATKLDILKYLIEFSLKTNGSSDVLQQNHLPLLETALTYSSPDMVEFILSNGKDSNELFHYKNTGLMNDTIEKNENYSLPILKLLLTHKVINFNSTKDVLELAQVAAQWNRTALVQYLLNEHCTICRDIKEPKIDLSKLDLNCTLLFYKYYFNEKLALDLNYRDFLYSAPIDKCPGLDQYFRLYYRAPESGRTLLHLILESKAKYKARAVNSFLMKGADINVRDRAGNTALHLAAQAGELAIVQMFTQFYPRCIRLEGRNADGHTPLELATRAGHLSVAGYLKYQLAKRQTISDCRAKSDSGVGQCSKESSFFNCDIDHLNDEVAEESVESIAVGSVASSSAVVAAYLCNFLYLLLILLFA